MVRWAQIWPWGWGVGTAHDLAPVFKNLDVMDVGGAPELDVLAGPFLYDDNQSFLVHLGQGQVVTRAEADYLADPRLRLGDQKAVAVVARTRGDVFQQCGEIVGEDKHLVVVRVDHVAGPLVAGAEVAIGVVLKVCLLYTVVFKIS